MKDSRPIKSNGIALLTYTVIFCVLMAGIFALFIMQGRSFVNNSDAYDQGYFWTAEMASNLKSMFSGDGYPLWSWYRGPGLDTKLPIDPFMVFASLFPAGSIELGYTLAIVLRLYFAGLAFILFAKEAGLDNFKALIGSIFYIGSSFTINIALVQGQFVDLFILFPLLVMSVDRVYKNRSPLMFILIVGITTGINYYLAFMAAIGIIIYIFFRYFHYFNFEWRSFLSYIGLFVISGIAGIMLSAIFVYVTIVTLSGASTGERPEVAWFYDAAHYYKSGLRLLSAGYTFGYKYIGLPVLALLAIPAVKGRPTVKATHVIMSAIMSLMALSPFFGSMFNGFGYVSNRWYFMLIFFLSWCAAEHMDLDELAKTKNLLVMLVCWGILTLTTLGFTYLDIAGDLNMREALFIAGNLAAGLTMIIFIAMGGRLIKSLRFRQSAITLAVVCTLMVLWCISFNGPIEKKFFRYGEINSQLEASTQRAGSQIKDDGFYRIDQMDWINTHLKADQPVNENLWWQNNTIYLYDSKIPSRLSEFNRLLGNNLGYSKRVYVQSNGNRMGLDFLYGVKYFLGDDVRNGRTGADAYAGYAFEPYESIDGVNVFRSRYDSSLGFVYDKFISESEFEKLSRLEREQALLQALVVQDGEIASMDETMQLTAADIETDIKDIPYEIVATDGITADGGSFIADKEDASVTIAVSGVEDSQLVLSFDNLRRLNAEGREVGDFKLKCTSSRLTADANNNKNNQTIPGIVDFDLNLGYYESYDGTLRIKFTKPGTYVFDKLYVSAMNAGVFDKYAAERSKAVFNVNEQRSNKVSGKLDSPEDGYLFLSIPVNANWNVYIDGGQVAEIHNANIAFFATPVTKGNHSVELRYDYTNRFVALTITAIGLMLMTAISIFERRNRKKGDRTFGN